LSLKGKYISLKLPDHGHQVGSSFEIGPDLFNKKAKDLLFHYSLIYSDYDCLDRLSELKYRKADRPVMVMISKLFSPPRVCPGTYSRAWL